MLVASTPGQPDRELSANRLFLPHRRARVRLRQANDNDRR